MLLLRESNMSPIHAMALALGICGAAATFGFMSFGGSLSLWAAFVAWASFFHSGGAMADIKSTALAALFGTVLGWLTMYLITGTPMGDVIGVPAWAAIVVFVSAACAVLASKMPALAVVPITMHALACVAAFVILKGAGGEKLISASIADNALLNIGISMMIGLGCGIATAKLAGLFTSSEAQAT